MKGSKEILIRGLVETGDIQPEPDKLDILIDEFREFKSEMYEFIAKQEKFNKVVVSRLDKIDDRLDNIVKKNNLKE